MLINGRKLNYRRANVDPRDFPYKHIMKLERAEPLPAKVDLTTVPWYPPIYDQLDIGSCTAQAACALKEFITRRYVPAYPATSRLGFYWSERADQGNTADDTGSDGRTSGEMMLKVGVGSEHAWPYEQKRFAERPTPEYFFEAFEHKIGAYYMLSTQYEVMRCLANGFPLAVGIFCARQMFEDDFNGYLTSLPLTDIVMENGQPAGHQVSIFGYETINGILYFKLRNSWGAGYALNGHFYMSADMVFSEWCADFVTYRLGGERGI